MEFSGEVFVLFSSVREDIECNINSGGSLKSQLNSKILIEVIKMSMSVISTCR